MKPRKNNEIAASWDREKISLGAGLRQHSAFDLGALKSVKTLHLLQSEKINEIAASWDRAKVSLGAGLRQHLVSVFGALKSVNP